MLSDVIKTLAELGIEPVGAEGAPRSVHTERRSTSSPSVPVTNDQGSVLPFEFVGRPEATIQRSVPTTLAEEVDLSSNARQKRDEETLSERAQSIGGSNRLEDTKLIFGDYAEYSGTPGIDPRNTSQDLISECIVRIIETEGPVLAKRAYDIYLRSCGIRRMGHELRSTLNKALAHSIRLGHVISEDESGRGGVLYSVVRVKGTPPIRLRNRGPRLFEELPPSELQVVARYLSEHEGFSSGSEEHLRAVLECFELKRLTTQVSTALAEILDRNIPHVDQFLITMPK